MYSLFVYSPSTLVVPVAWVILIFESDFLPSSSTTTLGFDGAAFFVEGIKFNTKGVLLVS